MFYIFHHLGLGDHIICNGMVRHFVELMDEVTIFCHKHYEENVRYMFRDDKRIHIYPEDQKNIDPLLLLVKDPVMRIGFEIIPYYENIFTQHRKSFDEIFYYLAGVDFSVRYDKFYIERDSLREEEAFKKLNPKNEPYIYVHDDPNRGFIIDENKHRKDLKIIKNDFNFNLFEMRKILENAEEIHTMQSGMFDLCNSMWLDKPKIYVHKYVRKYSDFLLTKGNNPVIIVE